MYDHLDVEAAVTACRLLWHKTRQRAVRESRSLCLQGSVMDLMAQMCGQPTPVFMKGLPDWKIISSTPAQLEATIRENPELYLNILLCHLLPDESALKRDFEKLCRRLGRDPRYRDFLLKAMAIYNEWAEEPDWEIANCPFPPEVDAEALAITNHLANALVEWSLPRQDALEETFRHHLLSNPPTGIYAELAGLPEEPYECRCIERTPPLHTFLPRLAILRIHRALADYRAIMNQEPRPSFEERAPTFTKTADALLTILEQYRPNILQAGVTSMQVMDDTINFEWDATADALINGRCDDTAD